MDHINTSHIFMSGANISCVSGRECVYHRFSIAGMGRCLGKKLESASAVGIQNKKQGQRHLEAAPNKRAIWQMSATVRSNLLCDAPKAPFRK